MKLIQAWSIFICLVEVREILSTSQVIRQKRRAEHDEDGEENHDEEGGRHHGSHTKIIDSLFGGYDPTASPTHEKGTATIITVNVQVLSMDDISDSKMEYVIDTRMTFAWNDGRLMTPSCRDHDEDCDDSYDMKRRIDSMWLPDLYILNSRVAKNHDQPLKNGMTYLMASGNVFLSKRLTMTLRCPMDLSLYPMDTQRCPIQICPYSLTQFNLRLQWSDRGVGFLSDFESRPSKFELLLPVKTDHMYFKYDGPDVSGVFSCVNATFLLSRRNGYHIGYSYTVTSFIVIVSWISFWLPVTAVPARVTLGVTTLLTLLTTANFVRSSLPPISYVTAIDVWVGFCTIFVFASLLLFPVSHYFTATSVTENPMTLAVEPKIYPCVGRCRLCGGYRSTPQKKDVKKTVNVDGVCRKLFPVLFIVFNVVYWSYYIPKSQSELKDGPP